MTNTVLIIIFSLLMLPGLAGVFLPILPSIPYMFVIVLIFGLIDRFQHLTGTEILILAIIAAISFAVDYLFGILGAKFGGASKKAILYGFIGLIIGLIVFPPFGGIAGLFVGVFIAEVASHQDQKRAIKAATGSLIGTLAGMAVNFILAISFLVFFIIFSKT